MLCSVLDGRPLGRPLRDPAIALVDGDARRCRCRTAT
jgi:hypothetical protein